MTSCFGSPSALFNNYEDGHKGVPDTPDDITAEWCQWALQKQGVISSKTKVTHVEVKRFQDEKTGAMDGGGMIGMMLRIKLTYADGQGPPSMVAKLSRGGSFNMPFKMRIMQNLNQGEMEQFLYRNETIFFEKVLPVLESTGYQYPKVYYTAIHDAKDPGVLNHVILNPRCKVKAITMMQDMDGWQSGMVGSWVSHDKVSLIPQLPQSYMPLFGLTKKKASKLYLNSQANRNMFIVLHLILGF